MKTIIVISMLLASIKSNGQYIVERLGVQDGLMDELTQGVFQDSKGIIWVVNGGGFTRYYGDHFDQLKLEENRNTPPTRTIGDTFYWVDFKLVNDELIRVNTDIMYHVVAIRAGEAEKPMGILQTPYIDKYGFYWTASSMKDTATFLRIKGNDTLNIKKLLDDFGLEFQFIHRTIGVTGNKFQFPRDFIEDKDGNLWFNTSSGRLKKLDFDSHEIHDYGKINNISDVMIDQRGHIWLTVFQTPSNINPYVYELEGKRITNKYSPNGEAKIFESPNGVLYLLDNLGVNVFEKGKFNLLDGTSNTRRIFFNSKDELILIKFLQDSSFIGQYTGNQFNEICSFDYYLHDLLVDRENVIWVAGKDGLYKCSPSDISLSEKPEWLKKGVGRIDIVGDPNATTKTKFYVKSTYGKTPEDCIYAEKECQILEVVRSGKGGTGFEWWTTDSQGNMYTVKVSTYLKKGAYRFTSRFEDVLKISQDLEVTSLLSGDLNQLKGKDIDEWIRLREKNGELLIFTEWGTFSNSTGDYKFYPLDTTEVKDISVAMPNDHNFHLYSRQFHPNEEFSRTDEWGNVYGVYETVQFDLDTYQYRVFEGSNDSISFGRRHLFKYGNSGWITILNNQILLKTNGKMSSYSFPKCKSDTSRTLKMRLGQKPLYSNGNLYFNAQYGGLIKFDARTGEFLEKTMKDGLTSNEYQELLFNRDSSGIWLRSNYCLEYLDVNSFENGQNLKLKLWEPKDGYKDAKISRLFEDSLAIMHTDNEVLTINLKFGEIGNNAPLVHFTKVSLDNEFTDWHTKISQTVYDKTIMPSNTNLKHDQNNLTFYFQGVTQRSNYAVSYMYKLKGLEEDYIATQNKSVSYPDLDPGDYEFQVKAVNEIGESEPISIKFHIAKPWYQTTFARIGFGALIIGAFFLFFRVRTAALRRRQLVLENKVDEATVEIKNQKQEAEHQRDLVEEKNKEIMDSITYAKRLQTAILPPQKLVKEWLNDSFIFYKPKDIVAGDFYWMETTKRNGRSVVFYAAADCTGHGVPGAMVSVVCSNALKRAIKEFDISDPGELLDKVAEIVQESFEQSEHEVRDGMDIAVCAIDLLDRKVWFSGAHNSLYRITGEDTKVPEDLKVLESGNRKLVEYSANKQPVGAFEHMEPFKTIEIQLEPGDCIYLFSDGFADQFGGDKGKKFKYKPFKQLLLDIEDKEMDSQKDILDTEFERWKGSLEQVDDVCIIGLRVNGHMRKLFSKRELEVIKKIKEGRQSKEIADEMEIAKSTVDTYRKRILAKTNLNNAAELIKFCDEHEVL